MAIGAQNRQAMNPAQFVSAANEGRLVDPRNYSNPNFNPQLFNPGASVPLVQEAMQDQARQNAALDAVNEARPFGVINQVLSILDKAQPNIESLKFEQAARVNQALNKDLGLINTLYQRAYKGDMKAQEALNNFTFNQEVLENAPVEKYMQLKDSLEKARLSVANSTMISAMNTAKIGFKGMVESLVGENNPEAVSLASIIHKAVNQSGTGAIQPEVLDEIQNRIKVYKANNPGSKAVDLGIVDQFRREQEGSNKSMLEEQVYGDRTISPKEAATTIRGLQTMLADPSLDEIQRQSLQTAVQGLLYRSGLLQSGYVPTMALPTGTQQKQESAAERFGKAWQMLQGK